jgi:hypothetical protein
VIEFDYNAEVPEGLLCQGARYCRRTPIVIARIDQWERPVCLEHFSALLKVKYPEARGQLMRGTLDPE